MADQIDREGDFRGEILSYGLRKGKSPSKSVGIVLVVLIHECYDHEAGAWVDWREYAPCEAEGTVWVVKADGTLNTPAIESLAKYAGLNDLSEIAHATWQPKPIRFSVKAEPYKDQLLYRLAFVDDYNAAPVRGVQRLPASEAQQIVAAFGSQFRAAAGTATRAAAPAGGRPARPSRRPTASPNVAHPGTAEPTEGTPPTDEAGTPQAEKKSGKGPDDIPF